MAETTYANQTSKTSGTSKNVTKGDKLTGQFLPLIYAAGGFDPKAAKKAAKTQNKLAQLEYKLGLGKLSQQKYEQQKAKIEAQQAKPGKITAGQAGLQQMLAENPVEFYPEATYVEQDPFTLAAIQGRAQVASQEAMTPALQNYLQQSLSGQYLTPESNPYLKGMYEAAAGGVTSDYLSSVLPQLEARFARAGGKGGAYTAALDRANTGLAGELGNLAANLYGTAYMGERDLMQQAAGLAPTAQQMGYYNLDELERAGRSREEQAKLVLQDLMDRWNLEQNRGFSEITRMQEPATNLPLAAGSGTTQYTQRTVGSGQQQYPSPPGGDPMWLKIMSAIL